MGTAKVGDSSPSTSISSDVFRRWRGCDQGIHASSASSRSITSVTCVLAAARDRTAVRVGSETGFFDIPEHKDIDVEAVADLRHLLAAAGYGIEAAEAEGHDRED